MKINDGKAATVYGDAVRNGERRRERRHVDGDAAAVALEVEGVYGAEMFDDSCEHDGFRSFSNPSLQHFPQKADSTRLESVGERKRHGGREMKACLLPTPAAIETNPLEFTEAATPNPGEGEVLVRVRACGVCRTDLHVIEGELAPRKSPVIPGHQVVGIVEKQGENARRFVIGARVGIAWLHRTDGTCEYCRSGAENLVTIRRLRATAWMAAMPSTLSRRKILFMRFRMDFPTSRLRRCSARESSDFVRCGFQELREAGGWDFMGLAQQRT